MNKRNLGIFRIRAKQVENNPDNIAEMFSLLKIVPVKVEYRPDWDSFEYMAIGERFEELKESMMAPEYDLEVTKSKAGNIELVEVRKI